MEKIVKYLTLPLSEEEICNLESGDIVYLSGTIYTARDAAHKRMIEKLDSIPFDLNNSTIYYTGPTPTKPGEIIGSCGPTSSYRMDAFMEPLLQKGVKITIGKGSRSKKIRDMLIKYHSVYLSAVGGTAVKIAKSIKQCEVIAYEDLESEAIRKLEVENFFAIVTYDTKGNDLFEKEKAKYNRK